MKSNTKPSKHAFCVGSIYRVKRTMNFFLVHKENVIITKWIDLCRYKIDEAKSLKHGDTFLVLAANAVIESEAKGNDPSCWHSFRLLFKDQVLWVYLFPEAIDRMFELHQITEVFQKTKS